MGASKLASKWALGSSKAFRKDFTLSFSCLRGASSSNPGYWFVSRLHYWKAMFWLCYIAVSLRSCSAISTVDLLHGFFSWKKILHYFIYSLYYHSPLNQWQKNIFLTYILFDLCQFASISAPTCLYHLHSHCEKMIFSHFFWLILVYILFWRGQLLVLHMV